MCPAEANLAAQLTNGALLKEPFRTKNATEPESVQFRYLRSFSLFVAICCRFFPRKPSTSETSPQRFAVAVVNLVSVVNLLSVVFLVREGPFIGWVYWTETPHMQITPYQAAAEATARLSTRLAIRECR